MRKTEEENERLNEEENERLNNEPVINLHEGLLGISTPDGQFAINYAIYSKGDQYLATAPKLLGQVGRIKGVAAILDLMAYQPANSVFGDQLGPRIHAWCKSGRNYQDFVATLSVDELAMLDQQILQFFNSCFFDVFDPHGISIQEIIT